MAGFVVRRLVLSILVLFVALSIGFLFFASRFYPLSDQPLGHAYWEWLKGLPTGRSFNTGVVNTDLFATIGTAFGRTLLLLAVTFVIVLAISIPLGCLAAAKRGSSLDLALRFCSYFAWAIPAFVLAMLFQRQLTSTPGGPWWAFFPPGGWGGRCQVPLGADPSHYHCLSTIERVGPVLGHLLLPALALAIGFAALYARYLRNTLIDALDSPYVSVARAKGLSERRVLLGHALPNALVTFIAVLVSDLGAFFGVSLAVDYVFQLGGLGTYFLNTLQLDVQGIVPIDTYALVTALMFSGVLVLAASMLGEVVIWRFDPRTRPE